MPRRRPARARARRSPVLDTVGVTLAGASEPASLIVRQVIAAEGGDACGVFGTAVRAEHERRGAGQRHGRARARLRRHVLRVARASERAARAGGARGGGSRNASRAAPCSTPTSWASRSRRGSAAS